MKLLFLNFFLAFIVSSPHVLLAAEDLLVPLKRSTPLSLPLGSTLHLSDSSLLKIREYKGMLLATGLKEGMTLLRYNKKSFYIYVLEESKIKSFEKLKIKLQEFKGLTPEICNLEICLQGDLLTLQDYKEISAWSLSHNVKWVLHAKVRNEIQAPLKSYVSQKFSENNIPDLIFSLEPFAEIKLSKTNLSHQEKIKNIFESYGFKIIKDDSSLGIHPIVDLRVEIVEIKKTSFSKIGVDFPTNYKASIVPNGNSTALPFEVALNALEQNGDAHVIASPRLSCRSGEQAHFLAGGEFPIKIVNYRTNDIQWKKHGILLNFKPLADLSGRISLSLTAEVSLLDTSQTVDGVPGLLVNRVESSVDMKSQETLSLSGLVKKIQGTSRQGLYALSQIPVLGLLFGSEDYRNDQSDLVIFITPQIL